METWKSLNAKFRVKSRCSNRVFLVTVANADMEVWNSVCDFIISIYCHKLAKFEHNRIIRIRGNVHLLVKKSVIYFCQSVDAILKDISVAKTKVWCKSINQKTSIFKCSKIYGNSTHVRGVSRMSFTAGPQWVINFGALDQSWRMSPSPPPPVILAPLKFFPLNSLLALEWQERVKELKKKGGGAQI